MNLKGKKAIITGASRGIGLAIAEILAKEGVDLFLTATNENLLKEAETKLTQFGCKINILPADLTDTTQIQTLFETAIRSLEGIDILINNAGIGVKGNIVDMPLTDWDSMFDLNIRATFMLSQLAAREMIKQNSGYIINIGSGASQTPIAGFAGYCATKYALLGFSESLGLELRKNNIKVSIVLPGSTATYFGGGIPENRISSKPGILRSDDVANSVLYLLKQSDVAWTSVMNLRPLNPDQAPPDVQ